MLTAVVATVTLDKSENVFIMLAVQVLFTLLFIAILLRYKPFVDQTAADKARAAVEEEKAGVDDEIIEYRVMIMAVHTFVRLTESVAHWEFSRM